MPDRPARIAISVALDAELIPSLSILPLVLRMKRMMALLVESLIGIEHILIQSLK